MKGKIIKEKFFKSKSDIILIKVSLVAFVVSIYVSAYVCVYKLYWHLFSSRRETVSSKYFSDINALILTRRDMAGQPFVYGYCMLSSCNDEEIGFERKK